MHFTNIGQDTAAVEAAESTPVELLLGCHARIRHFVQLSRTLATARNVPLDQISGAATSLSRYFSQALPLHEADENRSIFPRLAAAQPASSLVREAARTMVEQHRAIDELVKELLSLCASLRRAPARLQTLRPMLEHVSGALEKVFAAHLYMEETVVFPAIEELLTAEQVSEILHEMKERRRAPQDTIHLVQ